MNIAVRGIGIISALGNGAGETLAALRAGRSGIGKLTLFRSAVDVPVGEVRHDNRRSANCSASRRARPLRARPCWG